MLTIYPMCLLSISVSSLEKIKNQIPLPLKIIVVDALALYLSHMAYKYFI
jgi:hypothetical protein